MKKSIIYIIIVSMISLVCFFLFEKNKIKKYNYNLFYMDTYINVTIYTNKNPQKVFDEIDNIYKDYHNLTDKYNPVAGVNNIYYINNCIDEVDTIKIDKRLYDLLSYGLSWYEKSNELLNINMGNILDVWKKYRDLGYGVPTADELKQDIDIKKIVLLDNNQILNNNPNIDLGAIAKGYVTEIVGNFLEENGYDKYIINAGGNVKVGNYYNNGKYKIGIENPNDTSKIYKIINSNNISVVTSGSYQRFYEYNGKKYSHIINPNTGYPSEYMKSVTVITKNSAMADALSTTLFLMSIEDGMKYVDNIDGVEVIWVSNNDEIITTNGVSKYE